MIIEIPPYVQKSITENIRAINNYKETDCNRLLSIGRVYHTLSLVQEENNPIQDTVVILVKQFKPR